MKILHFSSYDVGLGAANNAYRIHTSLKQAGHLSYMVTKYKISSDGTVRALAHRSLIYRVVNKLKEMFLSMRIHEVPGYMFNMDSTSSIDLRDLFRVHPVGIDIIFLHWTKDFLTTRSIRQLYRHYRCPIVWFLCDMEPITGGCHYSFGCNRFTERCGKCPAIDSQRERDLSRRIWERKWRCLHDLPITFVNGGKWIFKKLRQSSLFKNHHAVSVPGCFDAAIYRPFDKDLARQMLGVPQGKKVIFFGAVSLEDLRKGMKYILEALATLYERLSRADSRLKVQDTFLLLAGHDADRICRSLPFEYRSLGYLQDETKFALAYQAADIFISASLEDIGPSMVVESMLCGTPVAAFDTGIAPEIIRTMVNGYVARMKDSEDLAGGMYALLTADTISEIRNAAYLTVKGMFSSSMAASAYTELFRTISKCSIQ